MIHSYGSVWITCAATHDPDLKFPAAAICIIFMYAFISIIYYIVCFISFRNTSWMAGFVYVNVLSPFFHAHKIVPLFQWNSILVILKGCSGDYPPIPTIKQWTWPHQSDTCAWLILDINTPKKMNSRKICKNQSAYMIPYVVRIYQCLEVES